MYVQGNAEIRGTMKVFEIIENTTLDNVTVIGSGVTNIELDLDRSSIYYFTQDAGDNWAVNLRANVVRKDNTGSPVADFDVLYSQSQYQ